MPGSLLRNAKSIISFRYSSVSASCTTSKAPGGCSDISEKAPSKSFGLRTSCDLSFTPSLRPALSVSCHASELAGLAEFQSTAPLVSPHQEQCELRIAHQELFQPGAHDPELRFRSSQA